jgi:N-acetylmuramoyl-L-alanine amidase
VRRGRFVVCIDPGHQQKADLGLEPIGPGAKRTAAKCAAPAYGVVTGQSEAEVALEIAVAAQRELEAHGVRVVLTRTTNAVDISNAERARIANECGADLYVRIHAGSDTNGDLRGVRTLYPAGNEWVASISAASRAAAQEIQRSMVNVTGARDLGCVGRSDLAGFNWSTVPVVLVECGYLSNPIEDQRLATDAYRATVARGIAAGVLQYLEK